MADYRDFFNVARRNVSDHARAYAAGLLMKAPRKNMERMEEYVEGSNYQSLQSFLSDSPWDPRPVMDRVASDVDALLGGAGSVLLVDESGITKKGCKSVGVDRQWNGRLGKVDNCQVGVFAALGDDKGASLIDAQIYLPQSWVEDPARCREAKVPQERMTYRSKPEIALEMILRAKANGVRFGSVGFDALYGAATWLLRELDDREIQFTADVRSNQLVHLVDPSGLPAQERRSNRRSVCELFEQLAGRKWSMLKVRQGTKGRILVSVCARRVWVAGGPGQEARHWWAVCVVDLGRGETKFFLSNFGPEATAGELVTAHAKRYWVERGFQDGKTSLGMADYQARSWVSWHHHMAMVMLAMLFCTRERRLHLREVELLSFQDLVEMLTVLLPRKASGPDAVLAMIARRHRRRREASECARRNDLERASTP